MKQFLLSAMMAILVLVSLGGGTSWVKPSTGKDGANPAMFTRVGRTAIRTSFAHLVVPLHLPNLKKTFDKLEDLIIGYYRMSTWTDRDFQHKLNHIKRLKSCIDVLHHLAQKAGSSSHFDQFDDINKFQDALRTSLEETPDVWRPSTPTSPTGTPRTKRQVLETISGIFKLAGFGLGLYNQAQINNIKRAAEADAAAMD